MELAVIQARPRRHEFGLHPLHPHCPSREHVMRFVLRALSIDLFGLTDIGESVLPQPDGRIVVGELATNSVDGYSVARINP